MDTKNIFNMNDIKNLDEQIAVLLSCKPLPESSVKTLCEKVSSTPEVNLLSWSTSLNIAFCAANCAIQKVMDETLVADLCETRHF